MTWTLSITGNLGVFISAVMMLHCALSSPQSDIRAPTIVRITKKLTPTGFRISCKVNPGGLTQETVVYWLAGGEFVELVHKNVTLKTRVKKSDDQEYIHVRMKFQKLSPKVRNTNFTCVALSPAGFDKENFQIKKDQIIKYK